MEGGAPREGQMPGPELPAVELTGEERLALETIVRRHTAGQQVVLRGRIILAAADGVNQSTIAARRDDNQHGAVLATSLDRVAVHRSGRVERRRAAG